MPRGTYGRAGRPSGTSGCTASSAGTPEAARTAARRPVRAAGDAAVRALYGLNALVTRNLPHRNVFERWAGLEDGGYARPAGVRGGRAPRGPRRRPRRDRRRAAGRRRTAPPGPTRRTSPRRPPSQARPSSRDAPAALHEPVGVEQHGRARRQAVDVVGADEARLEPQQQVGVVRSSSTVPSGSTTSGGMWPALDQRSRHVEEPSSGSTVARMPVASAPTPRSRIARSSADSAAAGETSRE